TACGRLRLRSPDRPPPSQAWQEVRRRRAKAERLKAGKVASVGRACRGRLVLLGIGCGAVDVRGWQSGRRRDCLGYDREGGGHFKTSIDYGNCTSGKLSGAPDPDTHCEIQRGAKPASAN